MSHPRAEASRYTISTRQRLISLRPCSKLPIDLIGTPDKDANSFCDKPARMRASFNELWLWETDTLDMRYDLHINFGYSSHLNRTIIKIIDFGVENIVYVSCKPTSLASDLAVFETNGYHLKRVSNVDMFPQTVHVECVTLLQKNVD